jgi:Skp family chaperone for outer membrane proteins
MNYESELIENLKQEPVPSEIEKKSFNYSFLNSKLHNLIAFGALFIAVIVLYILHFTAPKTQVFTPKEVEAQPGTGEIVYVNLDTINAQYELVTILTGDIKAEMAKQEAIFANREKTFQKKYNQFQENMNAGILTQVQVENAQTQLMQEYQQLEEDKERIFNNLQSRQAEALLQVYDSLQAAVKRINMSRNASFIITYQTQSPFLLLADPTKEITEHVLFELNRAYKK